VNLYFSGARRLNVHFDSRCCTEGATDYLCFFEDEDCLKEAKSDGKILNFRFVNCLNESILLDGN
jgi:hypothetical protein